MAQVRIDVAAPIAGISMHHRVQHPVRVAIAAKHHLQQSRPTVSSQRHSEPADRAIAVAAAGQRILSAHGIVERGTQVLLDEDELNLWIDFGTATVQPRPALD